MINEEVDFDPNFDPNGVSNTYILVHFYALHTHFNIYHIPSNNAVLEGL